MPSNVKVGDNGILRVGHNYYRVAADGTLKAVPRPEFAADGTGEDIRNYERHIGFRKEYW